MWYVNKEVVVCAQSRLTLCDRMDCSHGRNTPLSTGFPRQEYWNGLPLPTPEGSSDSGIESASLSSPALAGGFFTTSITWESSKEVLRT